MRQPVYVGCSMSFVDIIPDEEMDGLQKIVNEIMSRFESNKSNDVG